MLDDAKQIFIQEAEELLQEMEDSLLCLETEPHEAEHLNSVFRAMHTIKGSSGIFGYDAIVEFTHPVETELDKVRAKKRPLDDALIAVLLECKDHTEALVAFVTEHDQMALPETLNSRGQALLQTLVNPHCGVVECEVKQPIVAPVIETHDDDHWLISLHFGADTFRNGLDPISFIRYLSTLGNIIDIITLLHDEENVQELDAESCWYSFKIAFQSDSDKQTIAEVFEFAEDDCEIEILPPKSKIEQYVALLKEVPNTELQHLGEMLIQVGALTPKELDVALERQAEKQNEQEQHQPIGEILVEQRATDNQVVHEALKKQESIRQVKAKEAKSIRVDAHKLGQLINLVGELVISSASMRTQISRHGLHDVDESASHMEHLVEEIRDNALQLRMVQIGETFSRFRRLVRDVSSELHKEIELVISGGESELDKSVVEKLNDPLTHLVRNSLDHGIEMPDVREAMGKPRKGRVSLNAYHDSGHIVVEINDDGAGLCLDKIRAKAEDSGLIQVGQPLTRQEIFRLIFEPGLSTKEQATNLSGRGVGMDVVKRNIESLRGSIEIDSEIGKGTSISVRLPLTLAIIDGFIVGVENESYIIPLSMVEECVEFDPSAWSADPEQGYVNLRGGVLPFIRLRDFFEVPSNQSSHRESLVVVRFGRNRAALVVEQLLGEQQTVIKPLGAIFEHLAGISGATVLGSGEVALILDIQRLIERAKTQASYTQIT